FTTPDLRELGDLADADVLVDPSELALADAFSDPAATATARRNVEIHRAYSTQPPAGRTRRVALRFLLSPAALTGTDRVEAVSFVRNTLEAGEDRSLRARAT